LVLQATLDVEVANILNFIEDLKQLRDRWDAILAESKLVAEGCSSDQSLKMTNTKRRRDRLLSDKTAVEASKTISIMMTHATTSRAARLLPCLGLGGREFKYAL